MRDREHADVVADGRDSEWVRFLDAVDSLVSTGKFTWALPTLRGMQATVQRQGRVTAAQRRALKNIETGIWPGRGV